MPELDDVMPITTAFNENFISFRKTFDKCIEELEIDAGDLEYRTRNQNKNKKLMGFLLLEIKKNIVEIEDLFYFEKIEPEKEDLTKPCGCNCGLTKLHCPDWLGENENIEKEKTKCCVCTKLKVWRIVCPNDNRTKMNKFWCADCITTGWT